MPKKKSIYDLRETSMFTFTIFFSPGLPNLGVKIRCTQNLYTTYHFTKVNTKLCIFCILPTQSQLTNIKTAPRKALF